jgi:hypothetical protein
MIVGHLIGAVIFITMSIRLGNSTLFITMSIYLGNSSKLDEERPEKDSLFLFFIGQASSGIEGNASRGCKVLPDFTRVIMNAGEFI